MATAWQCERCGKFRKSKDIVQYDIGDQVTHDVVTECRWCLSPADRERFNMPIPASPLEGQEESND